MSDASKKLVEQQLALANFFDALMLDVQAYANQDRAATPVVVDLPEANIPAISNPTTLPAATPVIAPSTLIAEPSSSLNLFAPLPSIAVPPQLKAADVITPAARETSISEPELIPAVTLSATEPTETQQPLWAQGPFQAMLFKVAGLTLAVPLVELNGVVEWREDAVTEMPGHADFYLGLMPHLGQKVALIDTARLVLPPDKLRALAGDDPRARIKRIVLINDSKYGLACDDVAEVISLKPADVRWRTSRTQRRWLAGTVIEHMCALIDASAFAQMLTSRMPVKAFRE